MFWFERKAEEIENPKDFIVEVLYLFTRTEPGEGGLDLGNYLSEIENATIKQRFLTAVEELLSGDAEDWIKEELEIAKKVIASKKREAVIYRTASAG